MVQVKDRLFSLAVELILSETLLAELIEHTTRAKFNRYFTQEKARTLIDLLINAGLIFPDSVLPEQVCRDPDDDYLLALCKTARAHVLLTGDKDLLVLEKHGRTRIMNARTFVHEFMGN
jgi:uncharacterized protein